MLGKLLAGLGQQPFVLLFFLVAVGYLLGQVRVKGVGLGATAATLLCSLGVSFLAAQSYGVKFAIPEFASTIFFNLFMFSVGMKVGPQFLSGLRRDAKNFIILGLAIPLLALGLIFVVRVIFHPAPGLIPGIFAGANTATPGLGAAQAAYASGKSSPDAVSTMSTAFAFAYCISMILFILAMKVPDLLGAKTAAAARAFEAKVRGASDAPLPGSASEFFATTITTTEPITLRTYLLQALELIGVPLGTLRTTYPNVSIERVVRDGKVLEPTDAMVLRERDEVTLYGPIERLAVAGGRIGPEVYDRVARDIAAQTVDVVIHGDQAPGRTLGDMAKDIGHGLHLNAMFRAGDAIPFGPATVVRKGDVFRVTGSKWRLDALEKAGARIVRPSLATDIATLALGLTVGGLVGMITIPIGEVRIVLGSAVGLLLVGIALSTLRTRHPAFGGPYPEPARQLLEDLGLNVFIAILGINAGEGVVKAISQGAVAPILVGTLLVGFVPPLIGWFVGEKFLKMNSALLLGAVAGGRCNSAGMRAAQETSESTVPAISYPVTFAISNIILTLLSYVMALID
jgi:putative transport protein